LPRYYGLSLWDKSSPVGTLHNSPGIHFREGAAIQNIIVFQQYGSGERKIKGIRKYGRNRFHIEVVSMDISLPQVIDHAEEYFSRNIRADLVLDFLKHPDLSYELDRICASRRIPVVASGKKHRIHDVITPPT
jgi:hypothetical protein